MLVVGSGQSGGQIAEDLAEAGRTVFLATSHVGRVPRRYRGQDIVSWLVPSGLFHLPRKDFIQPSGKIMGRPLLGALHTISLQSLSAQGVVLLGRFTGLDSGGRLAFADDLEENISFADEGSANAKRHIDAYIERTGTDAPAAEPDPAETVAARLPEPPIRSLDIDGSGITTVIWCTGFRGDFCWVRLADVLDPRGQPALEDGLSALPGIYFVGMDLALTRGSGTILAIAGKPPALSTISRGIRDRRWHGQFAPDSQGRDLGHRAGGTKVSEPACAIRRTFRFAPTGGRFAHSVPKRVRSPGPAFVSASGLSSAGTRS